MDNFDQLSLKSQHRLMKDFIYNHVDPEGDKFLKYLEERNVTID